MNAHARVMVQLVGLVGVAAIIFAAYRINHELGWCVGGLFAVAWAIAKSNVPSPPQGER